MIQRLNENAARYGVSASINGIISSIEKFKILENSYDIIFSVSSLEHVESEEAFADKLREIRDGLRPGGVVCLIVNSDVREYDTTGDRMLEPQFEVILSQKESLNCLMRYFGATH